MRQIAVCASLVMAACLSSGCGGVSATRSVSPLDFILPGLMRNAPTKPPFSEPGETMICLLGWQMREGVQTSLSNS